VLLHADHHGRHVERVRDKDQLSRRELGHDRVLEGIGECERFAVSAGSNQLADLLNVRFGCHRIPPRHKVSIIIRSGTLPARLWANTRSAIWMSLMKRAASGL